MTDVLIRDAKRADAPAIAAIGQVAFPLAYKGFIPDPVIATAVEQTYSVAAIERLIDQADVDDAHFLVAQRDGVVVGYLHYDSVGPEPELHRIYVAPGQFGGGIGGLLLRELHERLDPGTSYILMVLAANEGAMRFYERHGFVRDREVDGVEHYRLHMGVTHPSDTPAVPALIMRFAKSEE